MRASFLVAICSRAVSGFISTGIPQSQVMTTTLRGGYDATIGVDPSTPIQFFAFADNTCPYAQRTHIALLELALPFDMTEVPATMPKPDWYLKINPVSSMLPTSTNFIFRCVVNFLFYNLKLLPFFI